MKTYEDITAVTKYVTPDNKEFTSIQFAKDNIDQINKVMQTDEILDSGGTVADCCRVFGHVEIDLILEKVTKNSKLVIEHWQCSSTPGYQVRNFNTEGRVYVGGNVGCWSGPYGGWVRLSDLARYASDEKSVL